ncbi:S1C family serine protease [Streptomyces sp. TRM49041]|uniref:S1C family serine protease n=1 Tax=Streptomyces sp. TRM49041 TaxID=2603216 RepID=UPI0011EEF30D|nr:trypsin-like peptidase domain-containing protein [Streptomyces sp. TRM49041]
MTDHHRRGDGDQGQNEPQQYAGFHDPVHQPPPAYQPAYQPTYQPTCQHAYQPAPPTRRRAKRPVGLIAAVAIAAAAIGGGAGALAQQWAGGDIATGASPVAGTTVSRSSTGTVAGVAQAVSPSIVEIKAASTSGQSTGSGVIITGDGEIVTNNHVISGASEIKVRLSDGTTYTADVLGTAPDKDLALIKLRDAKGLKAATLGDSGKVQVGEQVVAIGSPEGLTGTVTSGIVSALDRDVTVAKEDRDSPRQRDPRQGWPFEFDGRQFNGDTGSSRTTYKAIQTDASLNPGNSGGALINMSGEIIGINSAMYSPSSANRSTAGSVGLGFAIPVNTVKADLDALRSGGGD